MPDSVGPASEFGGKIQENGIQPPPHIPTVSERLSLMYRTGSEAGVAEVDLNGDVWGGLREESKQRAVRQAEGVLDKGQTWEEMQIAAAAELAELISSEPKDIV